ncbi:MAG: PH domain-containing protein [Bacteroidia bacterium]|nr:PH domain-containing protein [Bacteroidia bacterium]
MVFQNASIDTRELPRVEDAEFKGIDRRDLYISLGWSAFFYLVLLIGALSIMFNSPLQEHMWGQILLILAWLLLCGFSLLATIKGFSNKRYALREHDILYQKGWLWQKLTAIPFNRIQHVSLSQGPFERNFKLSSLNIYTAGGSSSDLSIPGLHIDEAQRIKDFILRRSGNTSDSDLS